MSSNKEIFEIFNANAVKLESEITSALAKPELSIGEIVPIYYQTMNVASLAVTLKQQLENSNENPSLIQKIDKIQMLVSEKFNAGLHPLVMAQLDSSIVDLTKSLQSETVEKSQAEIESKAKQYEKLRETMSTKEFVEQYDKGLHDDD